MKRFELSLTMTSEQRQRRQDIFRNAGTMRRRRLAIGYFVDVEQDHRGSSGNSLCSAMRGFGVFWRTVLRGDHSPH